MSTRTQITAERAHEVFAYEPDSGRILWRRDIHAGRDGHFTKARRGEEAGFYSGDGTLTVSVGGVHVLAHDIAWLLMTGSWPNAGVNHINGDQLDNRWRNLREATRSESAQTLMRAHADSKTGFLGVSRKNRRFTASISVDGQRRRLGTFDTAQEAHEAYMAAKREMHPFAWGEG